MLTVWCVCWGDKYSDYYVQRLQKSVKASLPLQHRFVCLTDRQIEGVETHPQVEDWPGWWQKISLFKPGICDEFNIYLDLDVVITGGLDDLVMRYSNCNFAAANNWAKSGHGGIQSSVMLWKGGTGCHAEIIYRMFDPAIAHWPPINRPPILWGDQEHMTVLRDQGKLNHMPIDPALIRSYKYHCRDGLPTDCRVVIFHGQPKPADLSGKVDWMQW